MASDLRPRIRLWTGLVLVSSLVLGCSEDKGHNLADAAGTPDGSVGVPVLDADIAVNDSDAHDRPDGALGDGSTLVPDAYIPVDVWGADGAPGDGSVLVLDAYVAVDTSGLQDQLDGGPVDGGVEEFWTIAILPDTQNSYFYTPSFFDAETRWIAENHVQEGIAFVLHEGDIVQYPWVEDEWAAARASMGLLDGKVPYVLAVGNHDLGSTRTDAGVLIPRSTPINNYFSYDEATRAPTFGGAFENGQVENTYHLLPGGGRTWLVVSLEFSPRDAVVAWADQILTKYESLPAILLTHAYLYSDGQRYDNVGRICNFGSDACTILDPSRNDTQCWNPICYMGEGSDGEMLWNSLVKVHSNLLFVFSGHVANAAPFDAARLSSTRTDGTVCHQLMADYQAYGDTGGDGYFRLVRIWHDGRVQVRTFSPYVDPAKAYLTEDRNQFDLIIQLPGG